MKRYVDAAQRAVLAAGLAWLYEIEQPPDALLQHHGVQQRVGDRRYRFVPEGARGWPVVVVDVAEPVFEGLSGARRLLNPLGGPVEMRQLGEVLSGLGHHVADQWNGGTGCETGSLMLDGPATPSLVAAVARYRAGCPKHGTVFCGWQGSSEAERACRWYADHYACVVQPEWPASSPVAA